MCANYITSLWNSKISTCLGRAFQTHTVGCLGQFRAEFKVCEELPSRLKGGEMWYLMNTEGI